MEALETMWECGECSELHDSQYWAAECCPPEINEVYLCPKCDKHHEEESDARQCCADTDRINCRALEQAGQQRLF